MVNDNLLGKAKRYRWVIFWTLSFGYLLVYFHRLCPAVVAVDMMRDLQASGALIGFLGAAYFYPYAAMQLPAGLLSDSWGPRNTITLFFCIALVGSIVLGMAPTVFIAILGRTMVGLGVAMLFVPTMKILAEWFHAREFAVMTGILMAVGGLGSLVAATPLVWLSSWIGWRMSFIAVGVFTLVIALLVWFIVRDKPADMGWPSPAAEPSPKAPPSITLLEGVGKVLSNPYFWPVSIWFFFDAAVFFSFGGLWGGPYLLQVYGYSKSQSGQILSMLAVGMIVGSPLLSYISTSVLRSRKKVILLSSVMVLLLTACLAFLTDRIPLGGHYAICFGLGFFSSAIVVVGFTTNKELFPVQMTGTATGLVNFFPFAGGAVFQPVLGYVLEKQGKVDGAFTLVGYQQAFLVLFLCSIIALVASFFLKETLE